MPCRKTPRPETDAKRRRLLNDLPKRTPGPTPRNLTEDEQGIEFAIAEDMIRRRGGLGIAVDDRAALEVVDGRYRVLSAARGAGAYRVTRQRGHVRVRPIPRKMTSRPLDELYTD